MKQADALAQLKSMEAELRDQGVAALYLFGSVARDEASEASDVDLFFDYKPQNFGVFEMLDVKYAIQDRLGIDADVMTRGSLHPRLKDQIVASAVKVF